MVIISRRQLEVSSFPIIVGVESSWAELNKAFQAPTNMVRNIVVPQNDVDVTADFAWAKGNLFWFNSGDKDLILWLKSDNESK